MTNSSINSVPNDSEIPNEISSAFLYEDSIDSNRSTLNYTELTSSLDSNSLDDSIRSDVWKMNYHESAIYLEEGFNNDKFDFHPRSRSSLPAYLVVHNHWFYSLDLFAALLLLSLALLEKPALNRFKVNEGVINVFFISFLFFLNIRHISKYDSN